MTSSFYAHGARPPLICSLVYFFSVLPMLFIIHYEWMGCILGLFVSLLWLIYLHVHFLEFNCVKESLEAWCGWCMKREYYWFQGKGCIFSSGCWWGIFMASRSELETLNMAMSFRLFSYSSYCWWSNSIADVIAMISAS